MAFCNPETGELVFSDGMRLSDGLITGELARYLDGQLSAVVRLPSHPVTGGRLAPVCTVEDGRLQSVTLCVSAIGGKAVSPAPKQRAFLFSRLGLRDPLPDSFETVCVQCPFGEILLTSDPHTGRAEARLIYG